MTVTTEMILELRKQTNAGIMDCKNALKEAGGDLGKAKIILREKGILKMQARKDRLSDEGQVYAYIHPGGKVGVLVEIASETDFVSKSDEFQKLLRETALQIAGMKPQYVDRDKVPAEVIEEEKNVLRKTTDLSGKPDNIVEKIVSGKLSKFYENSCLMDQPYFRDEKKKFGDYFNSVAAGFGEAVAVSRFIRYEIGQ